MKESKIKFLKGREIIDSRGNPTIEVELETNLGFFIASVPSGASKGKYEAKELRDGGKRYHGMGILKAINNINKIIAPKLKDKDVTKQKEIDLFLIKLDGRKNKSRLGANAILAVSMAICRAGAKAKNLPLYKYLSEIYRDQASTDFSEVFPRPTFNIINGGLHAGNELDFQEFMIAPIFTKSSSNKSKLIKDLGDIPQFQKSLQIVSEIYQELKRIIKEKYSDLAINLGDEGGFAPPIKVPEEALDLILEASKNLTYQNKIEIILDIASSQFYEKGSYKMGIGVLSRESLLNYYLGLLQKYPIIGLEDPFSQEDWQGWQILNSKFQILNSQFLVIGDDLLATNPKRIKLAKKKNACNSLIVKPNQIGTITETIEAAKLAKLFGWKIIVSHRSGETNDDFISDLAVGIGADFIKAGAPARGERVEKYNRLLKIEEEIFSKN